MDTVVITKDDEIIMKLLHYFITEKGYSPIILQGAKNEIWLENLDSNYKIVRIVSNYIHNDEQLNFDIFKTKQIVKRIKQKTFSFKLETLSIFVNLGEQVHVNERVDNISCLDVKNLKDLYKNKLIIEEFPDIKQTTNFKEKGFDLFVKITNDINKKNEIETKKAEDVFSKKTPYITYGLIIINIILFMCMYLFGSGSEDNITLLKFGALQSNLVRTGDYYRLITSAFLHIGIIHLAFNCYALYVIGSQLESFFGKIRYLIIYLVSAVCGNLLSIVFSNYISAGASGAIFGLLGALLYFGYHYRIYLGTVMKSQIVPLIIMNLFIGLLLPGIDMAAHIGGLIGGLFIAIAVGIKYKTTQSERVNGIIISLIYIAFLIYMGLR